MADYCAIGIDPGLSGAVAVLKVVKGRQPDVAWWRDLPVIERTVGTKGGKARRHNLPALAALLNSLTVWDADRVIIEDVQGRGNQVGGHQLSYCVGLLHMGCLQAGIPFDKVTPTEWKNDLRVPATKNAAVKLARTWLTCADPGWCTGPQGGALDGRAEAALIAYWGWRRTQGGKTA